MRDISMRVNIEGCVQGVSYRGWTIKNATELGLSGWVRNRSNGCVEAVFCGTRSQIAKMVNRCYTGPVSARVENITLTNKNERKVGISHNFQQLSTL